MASMAPPAPPAPVATYPRVLILGDSITWGSVASQPNFAYPYLTLQGLRSQNAANGSYPLVNGIPGVNTAGTITLLQQMQLAPVADLVIVELGTNDWGQNNPPATFQAQYVALLQLLVKSSTSATLIGLTLWQNPTGANGLGQPASVYDQIVMDAVMNKSGAAARATVDLGSLYVNPTYHSPTIDAYHPNNAGHQAIADAVLSAISTANKQRKSLADAQPVAQPVAQTAEPAGSAATT